MFLLKNCFFLPRANENKCQVLNSRKGHGGVKRMADKVHKTKDTMETVCYQFYVFLCKQIDLPFKN
jgi:hypothetical protein